MRGIDVADPYTERLMEGFAFLTSRVQMKMDAEFPRFSQRLLEMIAPNYLAPTPSMAIAEIQPDSSRGDLSKGFVVPRGTMMDSLALKNRRDLQLYHGARGQPAAAENRQGRAGRSPRRFAARTAGSEPAGIGSALRIRIACDGPQHLGHTDFDRLEFFLAGPDIEALKLLELVMEHHAGIVCQTVSPQPQRQLLATDALRRGI